MRGPQPIGKRALFALAAVMIVIVVVEAVSFTAFLVVDGRLFSWRRLGAERDMLAAIPDAEVAPEERAVASLEAQVLHPYLGYVTDPGAEATRQIARRYNRAISEQGFFKPAWTEGLEVKEDTLRIAVLGGSVATIFAMQSELLVQAMGRHPEFANRPIVVDCYATPGFKQPQQLLSLTTLLVQGEDFDVVLNIDGFNEITLPFTKNLVQGVHPLYPMDWPLRVEGVPDPARRRLAGELAYLRDQRRREAEALSGSWWRLSVAANLLWRLRDRHLASRQEALVQNLEAWSVEDERFVLSGPPWTPRNEDETLRYLAEVWRDASLCAHSLCRAAGIRYVHVLQPNQYVEGSKPLSREERRTAFLETHPYRELVAKGYPLLVAAGRELSASGVNFVDLTMAFSEVTEPLYIDTCCHFSWKGNRLIAEEIAAVLARSSDQVSRSCD
jgi:hypothetical protein